MTPGRFVLGCRSVNLFSWPFYPLVQRKYLFTNIFLIIHRSWRKAQSRHTRIFCQHWKKVENKFILGVLQTDLRFWFPIAFSVGYGTNDFDWAWLFLVEAKVYIGVISTLIREDSRWGTSSDIAEFLFKINPVSVLQDCYHCCCCCVSLWMGFG